MGWQLQFIGRKDVVNNANNSLQLKNIQFLNCLAAQYNYTNCEKKGMFTCANGVCILPSQLCDFQVCNFGGFLEKYSFLNHLFFWAG